MIKETFRKIEYSDESKFIKNDGKIELREYFEGLLFLSNFNSTFDAQFALGNNTPTLTGNPVIADFDSFGLTQHADINGTVTYDKGSFVSLLNEGSISFRMAPYFDNARGEQLFTNLEPDAVLADDTDYGLKLFVDDAEIGDFSISLNIGADKVAVYNALSIALTTYANVLYDDDTNKIKLTSMIIGDKIHMEDPDSGESLLALMGGVDEYIIPNAPSLNLDFFRLIPDSGLANAIILTHDISSHLLLKMYDSTGILKVDLDLGIYSSRSFEYKELELSWNNNIGQIFLAGKLLSVFMTGFTRENVVTDLILTGAEVGDDYHKIDELIIQENYGNLKDYTPATTPLTQYDSSDPYVDIYFGDGYKENEVTGLLLNASESGMNFSVKIGTTWHYFFANTWRASDGTFDQSTEATVFTTNFEELFFNENYDVVIRAFFHTDGDETVWMDEISILTEEGASASAIVTGSIAISSTVDLQTNYIIEISTDAGTAQVDVSSAAIDVSAVTLDEIKLAIDDASVPGLAAAADDGNYHLVLMSLNTGNEAIVSVDHPDAESALDLVWDNEGSTDIGEDIEVISEFSDYSEIYRFVRAKLGAPQVPVELTDEQLDDCISSAVYHYNKWRNFSENVEMITLNGSAASGYEIPAVTGGEENVTDVILSPRYPTSYYNGRDELMSNIYIQAIYNNNSVMANAADYHISLVATKDLNMILNTEITWEFINKRLFLFPEPPAAVKVGIKYKSALSLSEISNSQSIKDFTLAEAKITLGTIRGTFGNQIPGGDGMLQLNGAELKADGKEEKAALKQSWKSSTNVYEFIIG